MVEIAQRDVEIDGQRRGEAERADAADGMAGQRQRLLGAEHARAGAERGFGLAIVEPGIAARDEQEGLVPGADRQRLGDSARRDAERLGRGGDGGRALATSISGRSGA